MRKIKILGIDTSCDDTSIAVLEVDNPCPKNPFSKSSREKIKLLSNVISSQIELDQKWGGVYPALAQREHQKNLIPVLKIALKKSNLLKEKNKNNLSKGKKEKINKILEREPQLLKKMEKFLAQYKKPKITTIAITIGPGLDPCLWVGINAAKVLSEIWNLPIVTINHLKAHLLANWIEKPILTKDVFPAIGLVVSGGHTQLVLIKNFHNYHLIGETRDDAAGECFDKTARILGLTYPGGAAIASEADKFPIIRSPSLIRLPRPMLYSKDYDFSFSGLKTAVLYDFKKRSLETRKSNKYIQEMSYNIQKSIVEILIKKTIKAALEFGVKSIILGGGVTANRKLKKELKQTIEKEKLKLKTLVPSPKLATDNGAMVALSGYIYFNQRASNPSKIKSQPNLNFK